MIKKREKNKGFTLVELIVVLVILAILAAILVPALLGYIDSARGKQTVLNARSALTAAQAEMSTIYASSTELSTIKGTSFGSSTYATNIKNTADLTGLKTTTFVFGCKAYDSTNNKSRKDNHDAFTVTWAYYEDATGKVFFDGSTWTDVTSQPTPADTIWTYNVLP